LIRVECIALAFSSLSKRRKGQIHFADDILIHGQKPRERKSIMGLANDHENGCGQKEKNDRR
jgi:hypothetical protein